MLKPFDFQDNGRTFSCRTEGPVGSRTESWWWFQVSGDQNRYAPFQAKSGDTQESVRTRIAAYYADLLFKRSQPAQPRQHWAHRSKNTATTASTAGTAGQEGGAPAQ
ncbi:MAG TPA: hypothetical protein VIC24_17375 [Gemmatimonadaceae bacterium]|jgi:hypothetical protein